MKFLWMFVLCLGYYCVHCVDNADDDDVTVEVENGHAQIKPTDDIKDNSPKHGKSNEPPSFPLGGVPKSKVKDHPLPEKAEWLKKVTEVTEETLNIVKSKQEGRPRKPFSTDELKEALKNFKATQDDAANEKILEAKKNFRSIEDLRKEFAEMNMNMKTDLEILKELLKEYSQKELSTQRKLGLLHEFEYHLHQIDNAQNFVDLGGLQLLLQDLNSTEETVRAAAAFVLGSAAQGNPKVQVWTVDRGGLECLLQQLPRDTSVTHISRLLYALSSVLRQFPYAQKRFIDLDGPRVLGNLFDQLSPPGKLQVKMLTMLSDLYSEKAHSLTLKPTEEFEIEKQRQYQDIKIENNLLNLGWCERAQSMLALPDHNQKEKVLRALQEIDFCHSTFASNMLKQLKEQEQTYNQLIHEEDDTDSQYYFKEILDLIKQLKQKLEGKQTSRKTEL